MAASTSSSEVLEPELSSSDGWEGLDFDILNEIGKQEEEVEEKDNMGASSSTSEVSRVQTATGQKLLPPHIRIDRCRCLECGAEPHFTCKQCCYRTMFCKKCARRAHHPHVLKTFRPKDEVFITLSRHLLLVYYNHIVKCERDICLSTCLENRLLRDHFKECPTRPARLSDIIVDGEVKFDGTGFEGSDCANCGLYITFMFLHANDCKDDGCKVAWCGQMRDTFDMDSRQVWAISDEMKRKCKEVLLLEWNKVRQRQRELLVEGIVSNLRSIAM